MKPSDKIQKIVGDFKKRDYPDGWKVPLIETNATVAAILYALDEMQDEIERLKNPVLK